MSLVDEQMDWSNAYNLTPLAVDSGYVELSPGSISSPLSPAFVLGPFPASITRFYFGDIASLSVGCYHLSNAGVTSHGVLIRNGQFVVCEQLNLSQHSIMRAKRFGNVRQGKGYTTFLKEPVVSIVGPGLLIYGHWLVDFLPKLYVLHATGIDLSSARYLLPRNTPEFAFKWLNLLGIRSDQLLLFDPYTEIIGASHLIVPTLLRTNGRAHSIFRDAVNYLVSRIEERQPLPCQDSDYRRIYISRASAENKGRLLANRIVIEGMAAEAGFSIVKPETLSIIDQISIFGRAGQIIGEYGSGLHGSMFSRPGTIVCALRATAFHPGFLQSGICQTAGQNIAYIFGETGQDDVQQRFSIDQTDFEWCLRLLDVHSGTKQGESYDSPGFVGEAQGMSHLSSSDQGSDRNASRSFGAWYRKLFRRRT